MTPAMPVRRRLAALCLVFLVGAGALLGAPDPAGAQPRQAPDFAFGRPRWSVAIRPLGHVARAEGDFYDFVQEQLFARRTADDDPTDPAAGRLDFNAPGVAFHVGYSATSRLDVRVGLDYLRSFQPSEMRHFVGSDGLPIEQETRLGQTELSGSITLALLPRGRAIGSFAWIPSRFVPYVGVGAGLTRYRLTQSGEFVDVFDGTIFPADLMSSAWAGSTHVIAGADVRITVSVGATVEVHYVRAAGDLRGDFEGFEPIDLAGIRIGAGIRLAF